MAKVKKVVKKPLRKKPKKRPGEPKATVLTFHMVPDSTCDTQPLYYTKNESTLYNLSAPHAIPDPVIQADPTCFCPMCQSVEFPKIPLWRRVKAKVEARLICARFKFRRWLYRNGIKV